MLLPFSRRVIGIRSPCANLYPADDESDYRARIVAASDSFLNIVTTGFAESAALIQQSGMHILMDMQSHTRGGRQLVVAQRPAPIQVSPLFPCYDCCCCCCLIVIVVIQFPASASH